MFFNRSVCTPPVTPLLRMVEGTWLQAMVHPLFLLSRKKVTPNFHFPHILAEVTLL